MIFWRFRRSLQFVFGQGAGLGGIWEFLCPQGPFLCWRFSSAEEKRAALGQRRPRGGEQVWISKTAPRDLARGDFYFSLFTASDSRHNSSPGTTLSRGAAGRVCVLSEAQNRPLQPGKGRYCLPPITAFDSRHNLSLGTTPSREAAGRVCLRVLTRRLLQPTTPGTT